MLTKTTNVLEIVSEIMERVGNSHPEDRPFLEQALSGYIAAMAYAEIERKVEEILSARFSRVDDEKLSYFLTQTFGKGQGRLKKSDIADLANKFGEACKASFNDSIDGRCATNYSNLITCRHKLAHGEPEPETLYSAQQGIDAAKVFLASLRDSID